MNSRKRTTVRPRGRTQRTSQHGGRGGFTEFTKKKPRTTVGTLLFLRDLREASARSVLEGTWQSKIQNRKSKIGRCPAACLLVVLLAWPTTLWGFSPFQVSVRVQPGEIAAAGSKISPDRVVEAVAKARREIAQNPNSAEGYFLLGTALRVGGNIDAASQALDRAVRLNPNLSGAWLQKGLIVLQNGTINSAESTFEKAVSSDPADAEARLQLAAILIRQGDFRKALSELEDALRADPHSAGAYDGLGFIHLQEGDADAAVQNFRKAVALKSPYPDAEENLGEALLQQGNAAGARQAFEKALAGSLQDKSMATYGLASALKRLGMVAQANSEFAEAHDLMRQKIAADRAGNANDRGLQLWHSGDLEGARSAFRDAIAADTGYADAHNNLGGVLWQMKDVAGAQREFAAAVRDQPGFAKARNNLGNVLLSEGKVDEAIAQFRAALASQPGFASAHLNLAAALLKKRVKPEAQAELRQALELDPGIGVAHIELGMLLIPASGQLTAEARHELEEGLRLNPQLWSALPAPLYEALVLGD
jgi:Tfp pilus assembly protein PilF